MKDVKKYLDEDREGRYGFYFGDLDGEYVYKYNDEVKMVSAGTMKLLVATVMMKKVEEGKFSLDELILVTEKDRKPGSGILREFIERSYTVKELIIAMLTIGDNTATAKLMNLIGRDELNKALMDMDLKNTHLSDVPGSDENTTTAGDLAKVISHLYHNTYLNKADSEMLLEILRARVQSKMAFYLDYDLRKNIASKTGNAEGMEHEVALINTDNGNFVFSLMSSELPNNVYGMISLAKAGMMVWDSIKSDWTK